jgi:cyclic pyranopterin phosphate synthase
MFTPASLTPPADRRPVSLRVSVTDRCSLRCTYCMPKRRVPLAPRADLLSDEEILHVVLALDACFGLEHVRITGGEPLLRPDLDRLVAMLAEAGVPDLALTTNGQQLSGLAERLRRAGLKRVNVSLDSLEPRTFASITRGGFLDRTLAGIAAAQAAGLKPLKLNMVVMRGRNDDEVGELMKFAIEHDCQMRFLELMPIGEAAARFEDVFVPTSEVQERLRQEFTLEALPVDEADTSRNFIARHHSGRSAIAGFISPYSEPFCQGCRRLRLTSTGVLIGCLARAEGIPLMPLLRGDREIDGTALIAAAKGALDMKRRSGAFMQPRAMVRIGG